ncbi:MAG: NfeD family protein [Planctomycetes bacterium]|nr:NfeD family protein [Planctomycetota bacterium]MCP4772563.1 NfeD family protein [Planctomycetota bacterium]
MIPLILLQTTESEPTTFWQDLAEFFSSESIVDIVSWEFWLVLTIVLLAGEILTAGFLLGALTPGTVLAAIVAAFGLDLRIQVFAFVIGTMVGLIYLRPIFLRKVMSKGVPSNVDALVGSTGVVTEAIGPDAVGRVKVQSEEWRAEASAQFAIGTKVLVVSIDGNTLTVSSIA